MTSDLPEELLFQVFIRLPPKTLVRFRSVCKSWFSLIGSAHFISAHTAHNLTADNHQLLLRRFCRDEQREIYTLHDENEGFMLSGELVFPFKAQRDHLTIVGCVNGLICLWDDTHPENPVILWNPAIRKCFRLPSVADLRPVDWTLPDRKLSFGFGFDSATNDYKFLRLTLSFPPVQPTRHSGNVGRNTVSSADVFSLENRSWRRVSNSVPLQQLSIPFFLNGSLHWLTRRDAAKYSVVTFCMNSEVFREIPCPAGAELWEHLSHRIVDYCGSLSLVHQFCEHYYHIWVMREYGVPESWSKVFSINLDTYPLRKRILGFSRKGRLVLIGNGQWVAYPISEVMQIVNLRPEGSYDAPDAELYMESLVLLQEEDDHSSQLEVRDANENEDREPHWWHCDCTSSSTQGAIFL